MEAWAKSVVTVRKARVKDVKIRTRTIRTMLIHGENGCGHANTLVINVETLSHDIIGLQEETKRPERTP